MPQVQVALLGQRKKQIIEHIPKSLLEDLYIREKLSVEGIANKLGYTRSGIYRLLKEYSLTRSHSEAQKLAIREGRSLIPRLNKVKDIDKEKLMNLYVNEQLGGPQIGKILGVTSQTVYSHLASLGIKRRTPGETIKIRAQRGEIRYKYRENCGSWKGGRIKSYHGYILIWSPEHPRVGENGYVSEHILIWEQTNGRQLPDGWVVHHLNGIRDDNRAENLAALPRSGHSRREMGEIYKIRIRELENELRRIKSQPNLL